MALSSSLLKICIALLGFLLLDSAHATTSCCTKLHARLGDIVIRPDSTEAYTLATKGYWTYIAEAIQPSCVVSVKTVEDVSAAVALLTKEQCKFAVRSGGHSPWGSSNIADGVVISLSSLNQITVSEDRKVTRLGTGNRWGDVYLKLDTLGLAVPGGRVANVGVGGLITGGGISFFSPRYGFVCDNVVNFEVVLSSGEVVNANAEENSDLLKALKGSGNNLGVITAFDIKTFEQGKFVGGFMGNPISTTEETISALVDLAAHENYDPYAALIQSYVYYPIDAEGNRDWLIMSNVEYTATVEAKDIPDVSAIFQPLMDIKPQVYSTVRISNLSDFAIEINNSNPPGQRALFFTTSFAVEKQLLLDVVALTKEKAETLKNVAGLIWALTFQPLPRAFTKWGAANGGNILGLDGSEDQIVCLITASWTLSTDDDLVPKVVEDFIVSTNKLAANKGLARPYRYLNYSYKNQDPIAGYGEENLAFLKRVSRKYDPEQTFQRLVPGGHKLSGLGEGVVRGKDEL